MKDKTPEDPLDLLDVRSDLDRAFARESSSIRMRIDSRRYGKLVTVLEGFDEALDLGGLGRDLKRHVGAGGTVKGRSIELQGDHRKSVRPWLESRGYHVA